MNATPSDAIGPLSGDHLSVLLQSRERTKPIRKASVYAGFSGRLMIASGAILAPFAFSQSDTPGLVLAAVLMVLGFREMKLAKPMRQLSTSAVKGLAINQALVGLAVIGYAVWYLVNPGHSMMLSQAQAAAVQTVPEFLMPYEGYLGYAAMIAGAVVVQGLTMLFYLSKKKPLASFSSECPPWVVDLYRTGVMG